MNEQTEPKHSQLPWRTLRQDPTMIVDKDGLFLCGFRGLGEFDIARDKPNAAFVVRAVNNYESLVSIVKELVRDGRDYHLYVTDGDFGFEGDNLSMFLDRAKAVLEALGEK